MFDNRSKYGQYKRPLWIKIPISCQCLGQVKTPPLGMFVLDLLVLTALVIRAIMLVRNKFPFRLSLLNFCLLLLIGVGFFFEVTVWGRNTAAAWRQASIITSQPIEFLGFADTDQPFNGKISIRNTTTETVTVAGFLPGRSVTQMESIPQPIAEYCYCIRCDEMTHELTELQAIATQAKHR